MLIPNPFVFIPECSPLIPPNCPLIPDNLSLIIFVHLQIVNSRWLSGKGVGLLIRRLPDRFPAPPNDVVSSGRGNVPVLTVSRSG